MSRVVPALPPRTIEITTGRELENIDLLCIWLHRPKPDHLDSLSLVREMKTRVQNSHLLRTAGCKCKQCWRAKTCQDARRMRAGSSKKVPER